LSQADEQAVIAVEGLRYVYSPQSSYPIQALDGIDFQVKAGDYVVIIGHNGSGKSTLAKHLNALLRPTEGSVRIKGIDTREHGRLLDIRSTVGMVFQVPDNQIVATVVEEDVAFGPENLGMPEEELHAQVDWALDLVGMTEHRRRAPHGLSAGQKQRVAIAGVVAMRPEVLVLDESTAMLDPIGRRDVLAAVRVLNRQGVTVVAITHFMDEAVEGQRIVVMDGGRIVMEGSPTDVFARLQELRRLQLDVPQVTELAHELHQRDPSFPPVLLTVDELAGEVERRVREARGSAGLPDSGHAAETSFLQSEGQPAQDRPSGPPLIQVQDLHYTYLRGTPLQTTALRGVSLEIWRGEAVGIIGRAGSGKSTLVQHFNGLLRPRQPGRVVVDGLDLGQPGVDVRQVRQKIGLAFQYPEQQLFERLVGDDIAFGPKKMGMPQAERRERVRWAMEVVGLGFEAFKDRFTFSLSGGEMRKAALAGVLALQPEALILDESTSGLDPRSRRDLLDRLLALHREAGMTLILISPSMEDVAGMVDRIYVLDEGRVVMSGTTREIFGRAAELREHGLDVPQVAAVAYELERRGLPVAQVPLTVAEGSREVWRILSS
jgi:energy-coupling factor transport system ATP-binding protein